MNQLTGLNVLAAGTVDEGGLQGVIQEWGGAIKTWTSIIVGVVGMIFATINLIKAIVAFRGNNNSEGVKHLIALAIVIILTIAGIGGIFAIVDAANPVSEDSGVTDYLN